jgi:hypothetical protein
MLFFDDSDLATMKARFAQSRWPDFEERFLLQPAPATLEGGYDVLRWDGNAFANARTSDAKFASWIITENSVAYRLSDDRRYLDSATAWVNAAINTQLWQPQFKGNTDLFYGNLLYALSMFLDVCGKADRNPLPCTRGRGQGEGTSSPSCTSGQPKEPSPRPSPGLPGEGENIDSRRLAFCTRIESTLLQRSRIAVEWFTAKAPHEQRYTQNHFYIPMTGLLCAAIVLQDRYREAESWLDALRVYPPLIFDAMGRDGYFFEGPDYFHYAFIWAVRLAQLSERHLGMSVSQLPAFARLRHFLKWMYFPKGDCIFAIGDASAKEYNFARWCEQEQGQKLMSDNRLQNFSHALMWAGKQNHDADASHLAHQIKSRGKFHWYEGFWCLAWQDESTPARSESPGATHLFDDYGVWCCDAAAGERTLRVIAKCGAPLGKSLPLRDGKPAFAYDAGHCHPDAGSVLAAIDDVPIFLGPGYLGRKSGCYLNTLTFDGRGQQDDRIYHALDAAAIDYSRFNDLYIDAKNHRVVMEFSAAYPNSLGVMLARRSVEVKSAREFEIDDLVQLSTPRRPEARFRISDPPVELRRDRVIWRVAHRVFQLSVVEASSDCAIFVNIGEVISINDDGRAGPFEAGSVNQRGYQILIRPVEKVQEWHGRYAVTVV